MAAKLKLNEPLKHTKPKLTSNMMPEHRKDVGVQRGWNEPDRDRTFGFNRCREQFDEFGLPVRFRKEMPEFSPKHLKAKPMKKKVCHEPIDEVDAVVVVLLLL